MTDVVPMTVDGETVHLSVDLGAPGAAMHRMPARGGGAVPR